MTLVVILRERHFWQETAEYFTLFIFLVHFLKQFSLYQ